MCHMSQNMINKIWLYDQKKYICTHTTQSKKYYQNGKDCMITRIRHTQYVGWKKYKLKTKVRTYVLKDNYM